jgi:hypothetical protein
LINPRLRPQINLDCSRYASICRTDTAPVQAADIAYVPSSLQTQTYDPVDNLRKPSDPLYGPAGSSR